MGFAPVAFLRELVAIPSADPPGGELAVALRVHEALTGLGIEAELDEFLPGRANVVGRLRGRGEKAPLVFSAHMDTVPPGERAWSHPPFAGDLVDGKVRGRGAADMKSALAAFIAAAAALRGGPQLAGDVILAFTAGESANCLGARRLVERGFRAEIGAFLCGEPSTLDLVLAEKAVLWVEALAEGRSGHVSGDPGVDAIRLMRGFLDRLDGWRPVETPHPLLTPPSVAIGRIEGGQAVNVTPDRCRAEIDIRFAPGTHHEAVMADLRRLAPPGLRLSVIDFKPAVAAKPGCAFVVACAAAAEAETGRAPARLGVPYYSDGAILLDGLDAPFVILGPGPLGMSGQIDEWVEAEAVEAAARIYTRVARDWLA